MRKLLVPLTLAAAVAAGMVLLAWHSVGPPADLVWTAVTEVQTLDPGRMTGLQDGRVAAALWEGLTVLDPRDLQVRPGVAEQWEVSPDRRTYTFHLRPDARWSDGRPVTAGDFVYAWRRALDPTVASEYVYMLWPIRGAKAYTAALAAEKSGGAAEADDLWQSVGVRIEGREGRRLRVELEQPTAYFLSLTAFPTYLPLRKDVIEAHGDRWTFPPNLVSNGAYRLAEWRFQQKMIWEKNPHYWNAVNVSLGRIEVRVYGDPNTALVAYETGELGLVTEVPSLVQAPLLEARDAGTRRDVLFGRNFGTYFYRFNCTRPPLTDQRVRRALALAIDRRQIIERAGRGRQPPAATFVPPGLPGYHSPPGLPEDVGEAKRLLAEAGHPEGRDLAELVILVNKGADHVPVAELISQQWKSRLGLDTRIEQVEWKVFNDRVQRLDYDVARAGWFGDYLDPNTFLDMFLAGGGNNDTGWSDKDYDRLIEQAAAEADPARRMGLLAQAETILLGEDPIVPIYVYTTVMLARPDLEGVVVNPLNRIDFGLLRWRGGARAAD